MLSALASDARLLLASVPVFAPHPRIVARARTVGLPVVEIAGDDAALIAGLPQWPEGLNGGYWNFAGSMSTTASLDKQVAGH